MAKTMADGQFTTLPIDYVLTDDPQTKVPLSSTINGKSLASSIVLKSTDFSQAITGELMLANLTYTTVASW